MKGLMMNRSELEQRIKDLLRSRSVLTLAVSDEDGVWSSPVYYASEGFDLYFVSDPASRHCRSASEGPAVAASTYDDSAGWEKIRGLQMEGTVELVPDSELQKVRKAYIARFPFTEIFFLQFDKLEPEIAERAASVRFFRFRPGRIVLVDNSISFGFHAELKLHGADS